MHDRYKGKDCTKKLCGFLRKHSMKIINFKKKKSKVINKRAKGIKKLCYICKEQFENKKSCKIKDIAKLETIGIIKENIEVLHRAYEI